MLSFLVRWLVNIAALFIVIHTIAGVGAASSNVVIIAALIIGLLNAFLKPVLILLTLPLNIFSLGFFTLIINAFMFYLASMFVPGFTVSSFWSAFCAALLFSILSFILNLIFTPRVGFRMKTNFTNTSARKDYGDVIDVEGKVIDKPNKEERGE